MEEIENIKNELNEIKTARDNIKTALQNEGETVTDDIRTYANTIPNVNKVKTVNSVEADTNKNVQLDASKINVDDTAETKQTVKAKLEALGIEIQNITVPEYSIKESTTTAGYSKTYSLTKDGAEVGVKVNIPKDLVINKGTVKVVAIAGTPYESAVVGDKYLDIELNDPTKDHIYIPVKELVDVYTAGDGIEISANNVIKSKNSNLINGSNAGSLRGINAEEEHGFYTMGENSFAVGKSTRAKGGYSFASGYASIANGIASHAENSSNATGNYSHSEGEGSTASGQYSHAEGRSTEASGDYSHAENGWTIASGDYSHAEGYNNTTASGIASHAEGDGTKASSEAQHVQGKYNIEDTANKYAHIVGNGSYLGNNVYDRSNAHTVAWDGTGWFKGNVKIGGTGQDDANAKQLATQEYVNNSIVTYTAGNGIEIGEGNVVNAYTDIKCFDSNDTNLSNDLFELFTTNINENADAGLVLIFYIDGYKFIIHGNEFNTVNISYCNIVSSIRFDNRTYLTISPEYITGNSNDLIVSYIDPIETILDVSGITSTNRYVELPYTSTNIDVYLNGEKLICKKSDSSTETTELKNSCSCYTYNNSSTTKLYFTSDYVIESTDKLVVRQYGVSENYVKG